MIRATYYKSEVWMSPVETAELRTTTAMLRPDQIAKADELKARLQTGRVQSVSRSDIYRDALDRGFRAIEEELDEAV